MLKWGFFNAPMVGAWDVLLLAVPTPCPVLCLACHYLCCRMQCLLCLVIWVTKMVLSATYCGNPSLCYTFCYWNNLLCGQVLSMSLIRASKQSRMQCAY